MSRVSIAPLVSLFTMLASLALALGLSTPAQGGTDNFESEHFYGAWRSFPDLAWSGDESQHYCESQVGTNLASVHSNNDLNETLTFHTESLFFEAIPYET